MASQSARAKAPRAAREQAAHQAAAQAGSAASSQGVSSDAERYARLAAARSVTAPLIDARLSEKRDAQWPAYLRNTAAHIVDVLSDLALDGAYWSKLQVAERSLAEITPENLAAVSEILESDLSGLLDLMGYAPPPPSEELAQEMQIAFAETIAVPDAALRAQLTSETRRRMLIYVYRLRRLVAAVDNSRPRTPDARRLGQQLLSLARTGALAIIPATVTAGVMTVLFPPAAPAGAAAAGSALFAAGVPAATKEAAKQGIQVSSTSLLAAALGEQGIKATSNDVLSGTATMFFETAQGALMFARYLLDEQPEEFPTAWVRAYVIEAMRWSFEFERARYALPQATIVDPPQLAAKAVAAGLADLRDWMQYAESYEGLQDLHDRLEVALRHFASYV